MKARQTQISSLPIIGATCLLIAALIAAQPVIADGMEQGFEMKAVVDRYHGQMIEDGHVQRSISRNRTWARAIINNDNPGRVFPFEAATNLCVAYTMTGRLDEAGKLCDAAVHSAQARSEFSSGNQADSTADRVVALANRGVYRALSGDRQGARADFSSALNLDAGATQASFNLAQLESEQDRLANK